ncbi:MAG: peptide methionine sulfoxide reductase [Ferruginibacter sp.]
MDWIQKIEILPTGYSEVNYKEKRYGVSRTDFNHGKSIKIYAEELGGNHFVSFNYYHTSQSGLLKPCEMPEEEIIHFLEHFSLINVRKCKDVC